VPVPSSDYQSVERRSLREIATAKIKAAILDLTLEPGEDLKDEELQAWLGMSRTPVREALTELTRIGLVETEAQRFTRVANPDPSTVLYDLQTVGALLGGVTRVTVPVLTTTEMRSLLAELDEALTHLDNHEAALFLRAGRAFFAALRSHCPNPVLLDATNDQLDAKIHRLSLSRIYVDRDLSELASHYRELRAAIEARAAIDAELAVEMIFELTTSRLDRKD
jgi:DNA-binding GntR family transcriptional regulator